jgi:carbon-monoxide dehydrogenase medium subunit
LQTFDYVAAKSVEEIVSLLGSGGETARILCGGSDLLVQLREERKSASLLIDIKSVPEVNELYQEDGALRIGSAVSCSRICADETVVRIFPGLVDAFSLIGGTQIQGRASVGGNLCNASPAADSAPALIVHSAECVIVGPQGERSMPVKDFFAGPGRNNLQPGEFLLAVRVPVPPPGFGAAYLRFIPRNEMDIAVVGVGASVLLSPDGARFESALVSLGAVAPTPLLVDAAGQYLAGREIQPDAIRQAALIAQGAARPIDDMRGTARQRTHLSGILTRRALEGAIERAKTGLRILA